MSGLLGQLSFDRVAPPVRTVTVQMPGTPPRRRRGARAILPGSA